MLEASQSRLWQRIDVHDFAPASLGMQQRGQHARMVRAGILTDNKDCIGQLKVIEGDGAFAETERLFHSRAAGFVTHV